MKEITVFRVLTFPWEFIYNTEKKLRIQLGDYQCWREKEATGRAIFKSVSRGGDVGRR